MGKIGKLAGLAAVALKSAQGAAYDLSSLLRDGSSASRVSYFAGECAKIGAGVGAGLCLGEAIRGIEERLRVPKFARGFIPAAALTLGAGVVANCFDNSQTVLEATGNVLSGYKEAVADLFSKNFYGKGYSALSLAGATALAHSALRIGRSLWELAKKTGSSVEYAERMKREENLRETA